MTWFAFQGLNNGKAVNLAGSQEKLAVSEGFNGYATEAQAEKNPNSVNFLTEVFAKGWIKDYNAAVKQQSQPGGKNNVLTPSGAIGAAASGGLSTLGSAFSGIGGDIGNAIGSAIGNIPVIHALTDKNFWVRALEVVLGGALLITGLVKVTSADKALTGFAGKAAKTAVKVAPFL